MTTIPQTIGFGAGAFWGNRTDTTGSGIGPDQFAILQDISIEFGFDTRELHGQYQFPLDVSRGKGKISGKAKSAQIYAALYGDLFFGSTPTAGSTQIAENEAGTVPGSVSYVITVTHAANYLDDLGVIYASGANAGKRLIRKTSVAAAGDYSVNLSTGVYTFFSADASAAVLISYIWNDTGTGLSVTLTNQFMGYTPHFKGTFYSEKSFNGNAGKMSLVLTQCSSTRLSFPTRLDDYTIPEMDFNAYADATGSIGVLSLST